MKPFLALAALAGTATLVTSCTGASGGASASPASLGRAGLSPASPSPVNSATIGVSPPVTVTVAQVQAAGGVYRLALPDPSVTATPGGVYVSWYVTNASDVLARIDAVTGRITASVRLHGFGRALAAGGSLWRPSP
jgi:hypothetical protein